MNARALTTDRERTALGPIARAAVRPRGRLNVSFEFSPPKTPEAEETLWVAIRRLEPLAPSFVSVTYGLRGDPPGQIGGAYEPRADGYNNATELTAAIRRIGDFEVSVGLYPQVHPESPSAEHDIDVLKAKIDAGATRAISQFFFDTDGFLRFIDKVRAAGIDIPILPGIMPVSNFKGLQRMAGPCGIALPAWLSELFDGLDTDPDTRRLLAASVAAETCAKLEEAGFTDFHFYTLNRADLTYALCRVLGVRETEAQS
jgi:methylenetetrahydrofolate reductase (NADPH)